ncbi:MAG: ParB/RepB/Spo0J family partition protein [Caulobacterales bacterium]|nr:ParB/RepB/Spo0J family partition protein [Caulobacterales bacterium]
MSERHRGLGRGLSALLSEAGADAPDAPPPSAPTDIPIELIRRNPEQPRRTFTEAELESLTTSVKERGVLQPILIRPAPDGDGYQIVAGERRWRAAQRASLATIPTVIRELDDRQVLEIAIIENVQRADLNPIEEALGYRSLIERFGRTHEGLGEIVGKSRSHVANTLRLLSLPDGVRVHVEEGRISAGHARALLTAEDAEGLAQRIIDEGLSVRQVEALAKGPAQTPPRANGRRETAERNPDIAALERDLADSLGLKVDLADKNGKGALTLRYGTLEQLDELCRRLMRS